MSSLVYDSFWDDLQNGNITPGSDTFYGMLTTASYAESKSAHTKRSDITNEVAASGGYSAGGIALAATVTKDTANNYQNITFADFVISSSTIANGRKLVIYKHRGGASSADNLVAVNDFGSDVSSSGSTYTVKGSTIRIKN